MLPATVQTLRGGKLRFAVGADRAGGESIEGLSALAAPPVFADGWRGIASRTCVTVSPGQLVHLQ